MKYSILKLSLLALLISCLPLSYLSAQDEKQISFDRDGRVMVITAELEQKLRLFPDYEGLTEARLYQVGDDQYILEINMRRNGENVRKRIEQTGTEVNAFREKFGQSYGTQMNKDILMKEFNPDGKVDLLTSSTLAGIYYGIAGYFLIYDRDAFENGSINVFLGTVLLGGSAGFVIPFILTYDSDVTAGEAVLYKYGALTGWAHGFCLNGIIFGTNAVDSPRTIFSIPSLVSLGESLLGVWAARNLDIQAGAATVVTTFGNYGLGMALGFSVLFDLFDDPLSVGQTVGSIGLLGSVAGTVGGYFLSTFDSYTYADGGMIYQLLGLGSLFGLTLHNYSPLVTSTNDTGTEEFKSFVGNLMLGNTLALAGGYFLMMGKDYNGEQLSYTSLATFSGELLGLGLSLILTSGSDTYAWRNHLTAITLGGIIGYGIMYALYLPKAQAKAQEHQSLLSFEWTLDPSAAVMAYMDDQGKLGTSMPDTILAGAAIRF